MLADTMPTGQLGVAMGTIGSVISLAMVSAPVLGGTVYHTFGYEAVFYMLGAMLVIDVILRLLMIERKDAEKWGVGVESDTESHESAPLLVHSVEMKPTTSLLKLFLVNPARSVFLSPVSTISDCVVDCPYWRRHHVWTIRCGSTASSKTYIRLHISYLGSNVCRSRRPGNSPWTYRRMDSGQVWK